MLRPGKKYYGIIDSHTNKEICVKVTDEYTSESFIVNTPWPYISGIAGFIKGKDVIVKTTILDDPEHLMGIISKDTYFVNYPSPKGNGLVTAQSC